MQDKLYLYTDSSGIVYLVRARSVSEASQIVREYFDKVEPYVYPVQWITDEIADVS